MVSQMAAQIIFVFVEMDITALALQNAMKIEPKEIPYKRLTEKQILIVRRTTIFTLDQSVIP